MVLVVTVFQENGMRVYDVEVLAVDPQDQKIMQLLVVSEREAMSHTLALASARRNLEYTVESEKIAQATREAQSETLARDLALQGVELDKRLALDLAKLEAEQTKAAEAADAARAKEEADSVLHGLRCARVRVEQEMAVSADTARLALRLKELEAEVAGVVARGEAIKPDLVAALATFGEQATLKAVAEAMAPLGILGGGKKSVSQILGELLAGSPVAKHLLPQGPNGTAAATPAATPRA